MGKTLHKEKLQAFKAVVREKPPLVTKQVTAPGLVSTEQPSFLSPSSGPGEF